jgi:hybrid polyketide synthase/nonribosomal peptide synthetase ACE1
VRLSLAVPVFLCRYFLFENVSRDNTSNLQSLETFFVEQLLTSLSFRGYLNNKELTDQQFVADPYATPEFIARGWTRMYRTGDIGHLQDDGALVFHNRIAGDTQIKIRGLRIEVSDIESNILSAAGGKLKEAIVTLRRDNPDSEFLVAHVVFAPQHEVADKEGFLQHLLNHLPVPQYMIPVMAVPLDKLPLNNHSKMNRNAIQVLPLPQRAKIAEDGEELSDTMVQLKRVWEDVLGNRELGFNMTSATSFFSIGGNSLLIVRLQSEIRDTFNVVVRLVELLEANTLGQMARKIEESFSVDVIDWDQETETTSILPGLDISGLEDYGPIQVEQKIVLLTGATGFLAKYVLPQLVANPKVNKIHCVAVRDKASESPRKLAITSSKIVSHTGDLSLPRLGLSESVFKTLSGEVDVILHMGAARSFWDNYQVLRPSNVSATKELVKLATPRRVPIHYISSAGVLPRGVNVAKSVAAYVPSTDGSNGYVASRASRSYFKHSRPKNFAYSVVKSC